MIKKLRQDIKDGAREFSRARSQYIFLFLNTGIFVSGIMLTVCTLLARLVLKKAGIPYVTHTTIPMFLQQPWAILALLAILLLLVYVAYFQYSTILTGMRDIKNHNYTFKKSFVDALKVITHTPPKAMLVLTLYIVFALPLAGLFTGSDDIFSKVQIPAFIQDFMLGKWYLAIVLLSIFLTATYLAIKYMFILPLVVLKEKSVKQAIKESAEMTKGKILSYFGKFIFIAVVFALIQFAFLFSLFIVQFAVDELLPDLADKCAVALLTAINMFELLYPLKIIVATIYTIVPKHFFDYSEEMNIQKDTALVRKKQHVLPLILLVVLMLSASIYYSHVYIFDLLAVDPYVISHRGVDGQNGVQNTIPAMEATIKSSHPDYIEIDIHETKDGKFVLMHDENLKALCGVDEIPHDLTLEELTKLDASENGFTAKVCSFDDYLAYADEHNQALLIEIKGTKYDSDDMVKRFIDQYGQDIIEHGHILHSMQYYVVEEICGSELAGHEKGAMTYNGIPYYMGCIIPFNLLYPTTNASFYTMEETTINDNIIRQGFDEGNEIYAWTVNNTSDMRKMALLGVDGIITDEPSMLRDTLESMEVSGYASLVAQKVIDVFQ